MSSIFSQDHFQENARLGAALGLADLGCWELSLLDHRLWISERFQSHFEFLGGSIISFEDMIGLVHSRDRENVRNSIEEALHAGSDGKFDVRLRTQAGHLGIPYWVNWKGQASFSAGGDATHFSGILQGITSQVLGADLLKKNRALLSHITENTSDLLSRWDLNLARVWANNAFYQKVESASVQKGQASDVNPVKAFEKNYKQYLQKAIHSKIALHIKPNGSTDSILLDASFLPEFDEDGELESILVVERSANNQNLIFKEDENARIFELEDLNHQLAVLNEEYAAANEQLAETNQQLFQSNESLTQFAYVASHDLQEPLRKIISFGDLLKRQISTNPDGTEYLGRMQQAAKRMSVLIEDLLRLSHVSSRQDKFDIVDLNELFNGIISDLETSIDQSGAVITIPELPLIKGDARQLSQLFQNLISNAVKFKKQDMTPSIQVTWNIVKASNVPSQIPGNEALRSYDRIDIVDNGIGFDKKNEERIFKVFQRLHGKNEYEGTGIGLAICEKVVANHKGLIKVESQVVVGSTFSIYLPIGR